MKDIIFKKLILKNFLSFGDEGITIDFSNGLNVITGKNADEGYTKNGVGKSGVIDGFYYAIFGEPLRDIKNKFIPNRYSNNSSEIILEYSVIDMNSDIDYKVIRTINPKTVSFFENGVKFNRDSMTNTNKSIMESISANEEIFKKCLILQANNSTPFLRKDKIERKKFIEAIFSLNVYSEMWKLLRDEFNECKGLYEVEMANKENFVQNILKYNRESERIETANIERKESYDKIKQSFDDDIKKKIAKYNDDKKLLIEESSMVEQCEAERLKLKELKMKMEKVRRYKLENHGKLEIDYSTSKLLEADLGVCPTCKREYDETLRKSSKDKLEIIKDNIKILEEKKCKILSCEEDLKCRIKAVDASLSSLNRGVANQTAIRNRMKTLKSDTLSIKEKLLAHIEYGKSEDKNPFIALLEDSEKSKLESDGKLSALEHKLSVYDVCKFVLSEDGIKSYMASKLLDILNGRVEYFLNLFKSTFRFKFNQFFEEEIYDGNGFECLYNSCSNSESKKIDLAVSFAFLDILKCQTGVRYNILFLDEYLDSSMDDINVENLIETVTSFSEENDLCVYIITHKHHLGLNITGEKIELLKENSITMRI